MDEWEIYPFIVKHHPKIRGNPSTFQISSNNMSTTNIQISDRIYHRNDVPPPDEIGISINLAFI